MSQDQVQERGSREAEDLLVDPTFVARVLRDNEVFSKWIIGILEGCEGCTDEATSWAEGQIALLDAHGEEG